MSFSLVPEKYDFKPQQSAIAMAEEFLEKVLVGSGVSHWQSAQAQVVGLLIYESQQISCPICNKIDTFENPAAFGEMLTVQSAETIEFEMDCCGNMVNLAQIDLSPNTKFSRFAIEVVSGESLSDQDLLSIGRILGNKIILIPQDEES
jgi:hypothetical protein